MIIPIQALAGSFAENKDVARDIRLTMLEPALKKSESVVLDFAGVTGATQSFIHALISELFRTYGFEIVDQLEFRNCNQTVQKVIIIVSEYMQAAS